MKEKEVSIKSGNEIITVEVEKLPEIISSQIEDISRLETKVKQSERSAKNAMDFVYNEMSCYQTKGKWIFEHRSGDTKKIIDDTQKSVEKLAQAQQVTVEALMKSFEFQKKLSEVSKSLFELGCANITVNRIAVRAIEAKLSGASKETISDLAKQEMIAVVKQLKEQEDILKKQEELKAKIKSNSERLNQKDVIDSEQNLKIESIDSKITEKEKLDAQQSKRIKELEDLLKKKDDIDSAQEKSIHILFEFMKTKDELDKLQSEQIEKIKFNDKKMKTCLLVSIGALVFSIISILLQFIL